MRTDDSVVISSNKSHPSRKSTLMNRNTNTQKYGTRLYLAQMDAIKLDTRAKC